MPYWKKLTTTGALGKTPSQVYNFVKSIIPIRTNFVVEAGAGRGELSQLFHICNQLYLFEPDSVSAMHLSIQLPHATIHQSSIYDFEHSIWRTSGWDLFICSIPLSFYPKSNTVDLMNKVKERLNPGGEVIIVFTAFWMIRPLLQMFPNSDCRPFLVFPPYFVLHYRKT